jgi:hypothetical protein
MTKPINAIVVLKPLSDSPTLAGSGLEYLWHALKHRLEIEGQLELPLLFARKPSDFIDYERRILVFPVNHEIKALSAIKSALFQNGLLDYCEIGSEDTDDKVIRGYYPLKMSPFVRHFQTPPDLARDGREFKLAFGYPAAVMVGSLLAALDWRLGVALGLGSFLWLGFKTARIIRQKTFRLPK